RGMGFVTAGGPVPIVVAFALYDLADGDGSVRPGPHEGYAACEAATASLATCVTGRVGAGTGATIAKWEGREHARPGGVGTAVLAHGDLVVGALAAVNAWGDVREPDSALRVPPPIRTAEASFANTTLAV